MRGRDPHLQVVFTSTGVACVLDQPLHVHADHHDVCQNGSEQEDDRDLQVLAGDLAESWVDGGGWWRLRCVQHPQ